MSDYLDLAAIESLIDTVVATYPELGGETDADDDTARPRPGDDAAASGEDAFGAYALGYFLGKETRLEKDLARTGYLVEPAFRYGSAFMKDRDGHVKGVMGAIVTDTDGSTVVFDLDGPLVDGLIAGNVERPVGELVRITAYLVRIFGQLVGRPGFEVGRLRQLVGRLRELVGLVRLEQRDASGHGSDDPADSPDQSSDGSDNGPHGIAHEGDSTRLPSPSVFS